MRSKKEWDEALAKAPILSLPSGGYLSVYGRGVVRIEKYVQRGWIKPDSNIIDLGCGIGADAIGLEQWPEWKGKYLGVDAKKYCISFNTKQHKKDDRFHFSHSAISNSRYNPNGNMKTLSYNIPAKDHTTDFVMCHSFFSHTGPMKYAKHYLREIWRLLSDDGLALTTWHFQSEADPATWEMKRTVYHRLDIEYEILMARLDMVIVYEADSRKQTKLLLRRSKS